MVKTTEGERAAGCTSTPATESVCESNGNEESRVQQRNDTTPAEDEQRTGVATEEATADEALEVGGEGETPPETLTLEGRKLLKNGDFDGALDKLSWALEGKLKEFNGEEDKPELGIFYLNYGNALLDKEEHSNELFQFEKGGSAPAPPTAPFAAQPAAADATAAASEDVSDEELAWQILELARMCFSRLFAEFPRSGITTEHVEDASFVHVRLGDILTLHEKFDESAEEFQKAIELRQAFGLSYTTLEASTISLAQSQLFGGHLELSLTNFKRALMYVKDHVAGVDGAVVPEGRVDDYQGTVEDLAIQIVEVEQKIKMAAAAASSSASAANAAFNGTSPSSASSSKPSFLPVGVASGQSKIGFDTPQLEGGVNVLDLGTVSTSREGEPVAATGPEKKKRRIDLTSRQPLAVVKIDSGGVEEVAKPETECKGMVVTNSKEIVKAQLDSTEVMKSDSSVKTEIN